MSSAHRVLTDPDLNSLTGAPELDRAQLSRDLLDARRDGVPGRKLRVLVVDWLQADRQCAVPLISGAPLPRRLPQAALF